MDLGETSTNKISEQDFCLISQATEEFKAKKYEDCLQTLNSLEEPTVRNSMKTIYNKNLIEFYMTEEKGYHKFLKYLNENILEAQKQKPCRKFRDISASLYSKSVILFHLRKPFNALETLEPIANNLSELSEYLASKVSLLWLLLLITTNQRIKSPTYVEKVKNHYKIDYDILGDDLFLSTDTEDLRKFKKRFKLLSSLVYIINKRETVFSEDEGMEYALLKARQFYMGNDFQMAAKQLSKKMAFDQMTIASHGVDQDTYLANNMGFIHLHVRNYAIAANFFQQAIKFDNQAVPYNSQVSLYQIGAFKKPEILYNLGIAMLHLQRSKEAFECFLIPLKIYHHNPRLWLRVAETCIMLYEKESKEGNKKHLITSIIGEGSFRKYLIEPTKKISGSNDEHSYAIPNPTLEFAALCLRNATVLIEKLKTEFSSTGDEETNFSNDNDNTSFNPSIPISEESFDRLVASIYVAHGYVSLRLGDYMTTIHNTKILLSMKNLSETNKMLGYLYCAEALAMINRINDAKNCFDHNFINNLSSSEFETKEWVINSVEAAQSILRYNLAVILVLLDEFDAAKSLLNLCTDPITFMKFKRLKMYIELAENRIENCKIMVRIDTPQYR